MACGALLALAGVTVSISSDIVGPASAQVDERRGVSRQPVLAALPTVDDNVHNLFPVSKRPAASLSRIVVPVIISRVPEHAATTPVPTVEEAVSPDIDEWATYKPWTPDRTDTYRTVCVRLCDGAYVPVSFATTRDRFKADAAKCKSTCGSPAKLYVGPPDGSADDLVDVRGSAYSDLPNAFKYRTSYDAACSCKGQPWETAEVERHRLLAAAARLGGQAESEGHVEAVAAMPDLPPRVASVDAGSIAATKPVVQNAIVETSVRRAAVRSPSGWDAGPVKLAVGKAVTTKTRVVSKKRIVKEVGFAALVTPRLDASSMQRPFRSKEYWRLSYWDAPF
ncbi:MAG: DUF2865 domain-containing protein [Hyphomicrobiaceae bacterium]